jgi:hypothetical protein
MNILVQIPYDWDHIKEVPAFIIKNIQHQNITIFSPSFYAEAYLYEGAHDFTARMLSIALTLEKDLKGNVDSIPWADKPVKIYIGPAPRNLEFDEIVVYKQHTLSTHEEYLKYELQESQYATVFYDRVYNSDDGTIFFEDLNKLTEYLLLAGAAYAN